MMIAKGIAMSSNMTDKELLQLAARAAAEIGKTIE